ncbi:MAG: YggS family pyridoxal phosphate-dependent enzyme [Acidobacteria bacterium]|nr:YggS family pyridoxal phosphate-dependent enzyme [Acidobacteriota bacterium]
MGRSGLIDVEERIAAAAAGAGRAGPITLVVVAKYASDSELESVIAEGARNVGESRADSLVSRASRFGEVSWHFVGHLQGNKVRSVRDSVHLLHSMDRIELAAYWSKSEEHPPPVLVQVNLAAESQKGGVTPDGVLPMIDACVTAGVEVRGLMTVPPRSVNGADSARWFSELRELRDTVALDHPSVRQLSMGMTEDFPIAVAEGATILRVGRAIFDPFRKEG